MSPPERPRPAAVVPVDPDRLARPPGDDLLERDVLGAVLLKPELAEPMLSALGVSDFRRDDHQRVFRAVAALYAEKIAPEMLAVRGRLADTGDLEVVGLPRLMSLGDEATIRSAESLDRAARRLRQLARARRAFYLFQTLTTTIATRPHDADVLIARAQRELDQDTPTTKACPSVFRSAMDLATGTPEQAGWILKPYIARGCLTEFVGKAKIGKTSFIGGAVRAIVNCAPFLNYPTSATGVVWLTEERPATFRETLRRAELLARSDIAVLSYWDVAGRPWPEIVALADTEMSRLGADLLIVDTLSQFAGLDGEKENNSGDALQALAPLAHVAARGKAVWEVRHERKSGGEVGDSGRGSSAFGAGVDVVVALRRADGAHRPTMRLLHAISRFDETPSTLVIDRPLPSAHPMCGVWAESFLNLGTEAAVQTAETRTALLADLPATVEEAVDLHTLITTHPGLRRSNVQRVLDDLLHAGTVSRTGSGRKGDPLRFCKAEILSAQTSPPNGQKASDAAGRPA